MIRLSLKPYDLIDSLIEFETLTNYLIVVKYFFYKYLWFVNFFDRAQSLANKTTNWTAKMAVTSLFRSTDMAEQRYSGESP